MITGAINSRWIALHPHRRMDAGFWLKVLDAMLVAGVNPNTATDDDVRAAIAKVEAAK